MKIIETKDDEFVKNNEFGYFEQLLSWGKFRAMYGWNYELIQVIDDDEIIVGSALVLYKKIPLTNKFFYYIPRGVVTNYEDDLYKEIIMMVVNRYKKNGGVLKIDPFIICGIYSRDKKTTKFQNKKYIESFKKMGFVHMGENLNFETVKPRFSMYLNLEKSTSETFKKLSKNTQRKIKTATNRGVKIRHGKREDLKIFHELLTTTTKRNDFGLRPLKYFEDEWDCLKDDSIMELYIAEIDIKKVKHDLMIELKNKPESKEKIKKRLEELKNYKEEVITLGSVIAFYFGKYAYYIYGASSNELRSFMPNYLLQWEIIKNGINKECEIFDMYGISGEIEPKNKYYGLYDFKKGFTEEIVEYVGEFDYNYSYHSKIIMNKMVPLYQKLRR